MARPGEGIVKEYHLACGLGGGGLEETGVGRCGIVGDGFCYREVVVLSE